MTVQIPLTWGGEMWLHELMYGAEKAVLGQRQKMELTCMILDTGLIGKELEVAPLDSTAEMTTGRLLGYSLAGTTIKVGSELGHSIIKFAEVGTTLVHDATMLHSNPLIELRTLQPYKF